MCFYQGQTQEKNSGGGGWRKKMNNVHMVEPLPLHWLRVFLFFVSNNTFYIRKNSLIVNFGGKSLVEKWI